MSENNPIDFMSKYNAQQEAKLKELTDHKGLKSGDGGGTYNKMEARVTKLEAIAEDTRGTLESISRQLARMDTKLDSKPDQGWIINLIVVIFGLVLAAVGASAAIFALVK